MGTAPAKKRGPYRFSFHRMSARMDSGTVRLMESVATRLCKLAIWNSVLNQLKLNLRLFF